MRTHILTYRSSNYKILGERILYDMTNEQAQEFARNIKSWAHVMFPDCAIIQLESLHGGDVIGTYCVQIQIGIKGESDAQMYSQRCV